jgi:hypothetical protein
MDVNDSTVIRELNIPITAVGTGTGPAQRIQNPGAGDTPVFSANATVFSSQNDTLQIADAAVVGGVLKHDVTNYSTGYLPVGPNLSVGRAGSQFFTFKFIRDSVSKFDISWTGSLAGLWVAMPGSSIVTSINNWIDLSDAYPGSGVPGTGPGGNGDNGGAIGGIAPLNTPGPHVVTATFGTVSSSNTPTNEIYVRIKLIALTPGQTPVTALSLKTASN